MAEKGLNLFNDVLLNVYLCPLWKKGERRGGRKGSSFCGAPAKTLQTLRLEASKVMILRLRYHQDSQVAICIDTKL